MPTVFVVQEQPKFDISPALKFGDIKTILPPGDTNFSYQFIVQKLHAALSEMAEDDYLLLTGDPVAIGLTVAIASQYVEPNQPIKMLKWLQREMRYLPISVNIDQVEE